MPDGICGKTGFQGNPKSRILTRTAIEKRNFFKNMISNIHNRKKLLFRTFFVLLLGAMVMGTSPGSLRAIAKEEKQSVVGFYLDTVITLTAYVEDVRNAAAMRTSFPVRSKEVMSGRLTMRKGRAWRCQMIPLKFSRPLCR